MFTGYSFFDYKYNIPGYNGQDYDGFGRYLYLILGLVIVITLLIFLRNAKKETILKYLKISGIAMICFYVIKTTWESYYDITTGRGFNFGLLPLDACSMVMIAAPIAGFGKGKLKLFAESWLASGGIVGGLSTMLFLHALKYYPFFTFGALYSMIWHIYMAFTGMWLLTTNYVESSFKTIVRGFIFHAGFSVIVIIYDYIFNDDFMMYRTAGGAPLIEGLSNELEKAGCRWITTPIMLVTYFALFCVVVFFSLGLKLLIRRIKQKPNQNQDPQAA